MAKPRRPEAEIGRRRPPRAVPTSDGILPDGGIPGRFPLRGLLENRRGELVGVAGRVVALTVRESLKGASSIPRELKEQPGPKLNPTLTNHRREAERLGRRPVRPARQIERAGDRADRIIHAGKVLTVGQIEGFRGHLERDRFADYKPAAEPQIEIPEVRTSPGVPAGERRTVRGRMAVRIQILSGEQIKGMPAGGA